MKIRQLGFTLVEIAIVLVIIGLLLGGVLKGQELIGSAKVKNLAQDLRSIPAMIYSYQDKYHALPGDHKTASTTVDGSAANGDGDGIIEGDWNTGSPAAESCLFWQHLRLAHLASGSDKLGTGTGASCDILPTNAAGGTLGIESAYSGHDPAIQGMKGTYLCANKVPGKYVQQLDQALDNGDSESGVMRAVTDGANRNAAAVTAAALLANQTDTYTVCFQF
ncbi:MAG: prepilin-type N-terminal cleavage/methylation domain-containing protein [Zoogloea sp.]|nr:prepilin-type N-terminal cleavage/methylation domain-containing protein [Zoogloea sp.]